MAFTTVDLAAVETAIDNLIAGSRVETVRLSSGKMVEYTKTNLDDLLKLKGIIERDIATSAGGKRHRYASTSKGY